MVTHYHTQKPLQEGDALGHGTSEKNANHSLINPFYSGSFCLVTAALSEKKSETCFLSFTVKWKDGKEPLVSASEADTS